MTNLIDNVQFILERLTWFSVLDILLVAGVFFGVLLLLRDTQAVTLLRGVFLLVIILGLVTSFEYLPAFSWLVQTTLPTLLLAIPVIFAPEIRRALERLGRASTVLQMNTDPQTLPSVISTIVQSCVQLAARKHGALIVLQRQNSLQEYAETGVKVDAELSERLVLQIFYPNTPLHDGAILVKGNRVEAAACVMPLAPGNIQAQSPERQMGLRHRAAIGISEVTDAVAVVVSEETGMISVAYGGRIIRRLDATRLENILLAFYRPQQGRSSQQGRFRRWFARKEKPLK